MSLEGTAAKILNKRNATVAFTAVLAYLLCWFAGSKLDGRFPASRYVPGVVCVGIGAYVAHKEKEVGVGVGMIIGGASDLAVAGIQRSGLLARAGVK